MSNANENCYIILYDLFSRLWYIATCGPFCKDGTHIMNKFNMDINSDIYDNYEVFCKLLQSAKRDHVSIRSAKFNKYKHKKNKWVSNGIINLLSVSRSRISSIN